MPTPEEERETDDRHDVWNEEDDDLESDEPGDGDLIPEQAQRREPA